MAKSCKRPGFPRGTTPPLTFTITGYDLTQWDVYLTFSPIGGEDITKTGEELTIEFDPQSMESTVTVTLTQADTLAMTVGVCEVNMRAARDDGDEAIATDIVPLDVKRVLLDGEIGRPEPEPEEDSGR